ncbi:guanylate kinase, partial [Sutterella wadsworthensis]
MNKLYLVVAPSGAGKSTIIDGIFRPEQKIVSFTTRPIRKGEVDGEDYYFVTNNEFDYLESLEEELIQKAEYSGNRYGVTKSEIGQRLETGDCVIAVV